MRQDAAGGRCSAEQQQRRKCSLKGPRSRSRGKIRVNKFHEIHALFQTVLLLTQPQQLRVKPVYKGQKLHSILWKNDALNRVCHNNPASATNEIFKLLFGKALEKDTVLLVRRLRTNKHLLTRFLRPQGCCFGESNTQFLAASF
jgi:hypothetical protein